MTAIQLIVSDIDGTLVDSTGQLLPATVSGVQRAVEHGATMVLASARPPKGMRTIAQQLGIDTTMIAYNGALTAKTDANDRLTVVEQQPVPLALARRVNQLVATNWSTASVNIYSNNDWVVARMTAWERQEADGIGFEPRVTDLGQWLTTATAPVHKMMIMADAAIITAVEQALTATDFNGLTVYRSKDTYLEIVAAGVSKASALTTLLADDQLSPAAALAFGDNYNDVAMLKTAGIGVAMGNAPADVQAAADRVTTDNNHPGIQQILAEYF
ncbi:Cof-type HAD-IIB family hydrolase [Lactiplantibacillus plajomi]|uniref:Cof-type HAD-IIB family hydrolase n=1 Tax=Lactiplantibacillus plajomi TaxID=1457217 RepID=A0ABV6K1J8_9LACO|nr:Cof-type HAD-IIB family hydrolase [Lactiplantibacillus plajomi]